MQKAQGEKAQAYQETQRIREAVNALRQELKQLNAELLQTPTPQAAAAYKQALNRYSQSLQANAAAEQALALAQEKVSAAQSNLTAKTKAALMKARRMALEGMEAGQGGSSTPQPGFFSAVGRKSFDLVNQFMLGIPANGEIDGKNTAPADGGDTPLAADFSQTSLTQQMTENQSADEAEFADYQKILGAENLPETFAEFQEMKYNEPEAWKQIQWKYQEERTYAEDLANLPPKGTLYISDRQFGKKAKHTLDWGIDPADPDGRTELRKKIVDIVENCDEWRLVPWDVDPVTRKRTVNAIAYIKGDVVVLTDKKGNYISIMKDGKINNKRVRKGRKINDD